MCVEEKKELEAEGLRGMAAGQTEAERLTAGSQGGAREAVNREAVFSLINEWKTCCRRKSLNRQ